MKRLGIGMHSYGFHWKAATRFHDPLTFLEYARSLGAGGVQVNIGPRDGDYARKLRERCEETQMYLESQAALPAEETQVERFTAEARAAQMAGVTIMRTAMLSGRRYETFKSADDFRTFTRKSWDALTRAEPIAKKYGLRLAVENHKDWLIPELLDMMRRISSEHVGICVDTGNSIALLEDAMAVVEAYAPFAATTHLKDMGVATCESGFLLSEVPLGAGYLDLRRVIQIIERANPRIQWNLEMITRDPLEIPCLTQKYWATLNDLRAQQLAQAIGAVRQNQKTLPRVSHLSDADKLKAEDDNVRQSLSAFTGLLSP